MSTSDPGAALRGRRSDCDALDRLPTSVRAGQSQVLVMRGEAGVGKSALLEYLVRSASGFRVARAGGHEYGMELRPRRRVASPRRHRRPKMFAAIQNGVADSTHV